MALRRTFAWISLFLLCLAAPGFLAAQTPAPEPALIHPWNCSFGIGRLDFEGDEWVKDGFYGIGRLGYEFNERWTIEGLLAIAPTLDANVRDNRENPDWSDATFIGGGVDGLYHFTRWERFDPYLAAGLHLAYYTEEQVSGNDSDTALRAGAGAMWHFNDEWALRADVRLALAGFGSDSEANAMIDAGMNWTWGAGIPPQYMVSGGAVDSDAEGLTDAEEKGIYNTNPFNPDTDGDGLDDYSEVKKYKTDPNNPDTDYDGLQDGPEVYHWGTNPTDRDTDDGGVADGHEVIEDGTDPLYGPDDLILYILDIKFDYDKSVIKPQYFDQLNVIGKVLTRDPGATARIEGHADKLKTSKYDYNMQLSDRRARSVVDYLVEHARIERSRLTPAGYGYTRPMVPNHPIDGNPKNRRVEIYIRPSGRPAPVFRKPPTEKTPAMSVVPVTVPAAAPAAPAAVVVPAAAPAPAARGAAAPVVAPPGMAQ